MCAGCEGGRSTLDAPPSPRVTASASATSRCASAPPPGAAATGAGAEEGGPAAAGTHAPASSLSSASSSAWRRASSSAAAAASARRGTCVGPSLLVYGGERDRMKHLRKCFMPCEPERRHAGGSDIYCQRAGRQRVHGSSGSATTAAASKAGRAPPFSRNTIGPCLARQAGAARRAWCQAQGLLLCCLGLVVSRELIQAVFLFNMPLS